MRPSLVPLYIPTIAALLAFPCQAVMADVTAASMMQLQPVMKGVKLDAPSPEALEKCRVRRIERDGVYGYVLLDADRVPLRKFISTNGDKRTDRWIYYRDGKEVYRDVDSDFDGVADKAVRTYSLAFNQSGELTVQAPNATPTSTDAATAEPPSAQTPGSSIAPPEAGRQEQTPVPAKAD